MHRKVKLITIIIITIISILYLSKKSYASELDITDSFVDENLRNEILKLAQVATGEEEKTKIYESDIDKIVEQPGGTSLKLAGKGIKDLSGIEVFAEKNITWIFLDWNEIADLSPLKNFQSLTKISFSGNEIADLTPLSNLINLTNITAINNKITTIEPLKSLTNIKYLCLDGNNLKEVNTIQSLINIEDISFQNNQIEKIPNLSGLKKLESLNLSNNKIQALSTIGEPINLKELQIDSNLLTSLEGVGNLINLTVFSCSNNQISEITDIGQLTKLENLNLNKNQLESIEILKQNTQIEYLYLDSNFIQTFDILEQLENLKKYSIYNQTITVEIKEELVEEFILVPLPSLYYNLYNSNNFIYNQEITTEVIGTEDYEIDDNKENIKIRTTDLEKNDITVKVRDNENTYLTYNIQIDKTAPRIEGVENNQRYFEPITPTSQDEDISKVILVKDEEEVQYELGTTISETGSYTLIVRDRAGNETRIIFEIVNSLEENEIYRIEGQYIIGIENNTKLTLFKQILDGNVSYDVYRENKLLQDNDIIATGDKLETDTGRTFYLIVKGDITKDGNTNIKDLVKLRSCLLKITTFDEVQIRAADISEDDEINIKDLVQIRKILLNKNI